MSANLIKLTKRQRRVLSESLRHRGSHFQFIKCWRGKYYRGDYEVGARPTGTKTADELVRLGLFEFLNNGLDSFYRHTEAAERFICRHREKDWYCSNGKKHKHFSDEWPRGDCHVCEGFGATLEIHNQGEQS